MCSCTNNFTCSRCAGTPFDPRYFEDEPGELSPEEFTELIYEPRVGPVAFMLAEDRDS